MSTRFVILTNPSPELQKAIAASLARATPRKGDTGATLPTDGKARRFHLLALEQQADRLGSRFDRIARIYRDKVLAEIRASGLLD